MPLLEPPTNPLRPTPPSPDEGETPQPHRRLSSRKITLSKGSKYADLEDHELIYMLDSLDDETARARFRESIYISVIICMAVAWFLLYGPRILWHQPEYKDVFTALKEQDKAITLSMPVTPHVAPKPPARSMPDKSTMQRLQQEARTAPSAPAPQEAPAPAQQTPAPQQQASTAPPVQTPALPLPSAPRPAPLVDAPSPSPRIAQNTPGDSMQDVLRGARNGHGGEYAPGPSSAAGPVQAGAQILSDTQGVDFSAYLRRIISDTQRNWDPLIPEEVRPPILKKGIVGIRFAILPGGQIGSMTLETRSGDVSLDKAAWFAITSEGNFPPLPKEFHGPQLELRFGFFYNEPVQR